MDERDERKRTSGDASKRLRWHQNWSCSTAPGRVWREPTYWPHGVRCIGGMTLIRALVWNLRTYPTMPREKVTNVGSGPTGNRKSPLFSTEGGGLRSVARAG